MTKPLALARLGELERIIMKRLWGSGPGDAKSLHKSIGRPRHITLNTVQSTVERLFRKGLLDREKVSHAYVYAPRVTREQFSAEIMRELVRELFGGTLKPVLAALVDLTARFGDDELLHLEELVAARRRGGAPK